MPHDVTLLQNVCSAFAGHGLFNPSSLFLSCHFIYLKHLCNTHFFACLCKTHLHIQTKSTHPVRLEIWFGLYLCSVVHHEVRASHRVGAFGWRDPKVITAGVPHGEETERVPPLVCHTQRRLFDNNTQST